MLEIINHLPAGILESPADKLNEVLPGPTLIHLPGREPAPLFVSTLLHGNETTGLLALQTLLKNYQQRELPRALSIFIGNVEAARYGKRHLADQADYNRIWTPGRTSEHRMTQRIVEEMAAREVFASIDIHNNSGFNPHYAIVTRMDHRDFQLATLFDRTVVYTTRPDTTCTMAFAELCPSVTIECGLSGVGHGIEHTVEYLESCLRLSQLPDSPVAAHDMDLFHTVAIVRVPEECSFDFGGTDTDLQLTAEMDRLNFRELGEGYIFAKVRDGSRVMFDVRDEYGHDAAQRMFELVGNEVRLTRPLMPCMLTLNKEIIRMDCLCYLMERLDWREQALAGRARGHA
jgi:hypothetical protein